MDEFKKIRKCVDEYTVDQPKQKKSFSLSREAIEALKNLEVVLKKESQSEVIESLILSAWKKIDE